ncbi:MAG: hypothetical protein U9R03_00435, partial [Candidatus Aerophobetes bacterium]|nr:hypothetical protein [Candidatus Aerophobetes bacterium]
MAIERFKAAYANWRHNPFTGEDLAVDKIEDGLYIPGSAPFLIQLLEVPWKNDPSTVAVRCYDIKTDVDQDSAAGQAVLYVASTTGFAADNLIIIDRGGEREEEKVVLSVQAGVSLTLTSNLTYTHTTVQADDVEKYINFTEVLTAPAQSQFRVDYPPPDGEGTGLVEFNQNDTEKEVRVSYKATGSPMLSEFLDTKISYPACNPLDNQIIAFKSNLPEYRNNPIRYFHEGPVIYHASGENESCLLFRFKKSANESKVFLELKGAKLHQGYYTELKKHLHAKGTLAITGSTGKQSTNHTHGYSGVTDYGSV